MYRKRERTQNWSLEEKKYLLDLVKSRLDVLENKRIDSASSAMKGMAWQDIHASFAARFGNDRDAHRVREQWRRMKGQSRTEMLEFADRVRTYGAEFANQRWPSALAEEVWKTLEAARNINDFQQGYGLGDDAGSPVILDDDDEDGDDVAMEAERGGAGDRWGEPRAARDRCTLLPSGMARGDRADARMPENGIKMEPEPDDRFDRHQDHHQDHDDGDGGPAGELMSMLLPKVELNDVPDLDTSMVPSGLSITAVKIGSGGAKRRLVEKHDLPVRNPWGSPAAPPAPAPAAAPPRAGTPAARGSTPQQHHYLHHHLGASGIGAGLGHGVGHGGAAANNHHHTPPAHTSSAPASAEQRRRLEVLEAEHHAKMALLRLERQTAEVRLRIALRDEEAAGALTCRSCGAGPRGRGSRDASDAATRRGAATPNARSDARGGSAAAAAGVSDDVEADADPDLDNDATTASSVATQGRLSPFDDASRDSSDRGGSGSEQSPVANGVKEEDDNNNEDQVRFAGGLGEPGSGAGKGGGSGGSIRDAGGSMGKREAAFEEEYFYKQQKEQLKKLKSDLADEIGFHEEQIKRHQEAIARHKQRVSDLDKDK